MMTRQTFRNDCIILKTIDELVPQEHLVRKLDAAINLKFIEDEVEDLYSAFGKPSIPPLVLFKLLIINYMFGINSMRKTCEECEVNLAYRWYLGISIDDKIPNYSTWSQNYIRRYRGTKIFKVIFYKVYQIPFVTLQYLSQIPSASSCLHRFSLILSLIFCSWNVTH